MDLTAEVRRAMESRLAEFAKRERLAVVFENVPEKMRPETFVVAALMPADTAAGTMAGSLQQGIFQMSCFLPPDKGVAAADRLAGELMGLFVPDKPIGRLAFRYARRSAGYRVEERYAVVVSVPYFVMD